MTSIRIYIYLKIKQIYTIMQKKKRIDVYNPWFYVVILPKKFYQIFRVEFSSTPHKKTAVSEIFRGSEYNNEKFPRNKEHSYEVQRIQYKPGMHTL